MFRFKVLRMSLSWSSKRLLLLHNLSLKLGDQTNKYSKINDIDTFVDLISNITAQSFFKSQTKKQLRYSEEDIENIIAETSIAEFHLIR